MPSEYVHSEPLLIAQGACIRAEFRAERCGLIHRQGAKTHCKLKRKSFPSLRPTMVVRMVSHRGGIRFGSRIWEGKVLDMHSQSPQSSGLKGTFLIYSHNLGQLVIHRFVSSR